MNHKLVRSLFKLGALALAVPAAHAVTGENFDYGAYFRSGVGTNNKGGSQIQFSNPLVDDHNDFRLGNEPNSYGELKFRAYTLKPANEGDKFFAAHTMLSFYTPNRAGIETPGVGLREFYVEGGNLFDQKIGVWAGKRYYRDQDVHMNDFYYYAAILGNGAGINQIKTGWGQAALAWFVNSGEPTTTQIAAPKTQYLDLRLTDAPLAQNLAINFWLGASKQASADAVTVGTGEDSSIGTPYGSYGGAVAGTRVRLTLEKGTNDFAVMFGNGLLASLDLEGVRPVSGINLPSVGVAPGSRINGANTFRVVDHATMSFAQGAFHAAGIYEWRKNYLKRDGVGHYWSVGVRPVYFVTDNFHVAVEIGHNETRDDAATDKVFRLTRVTLMPELVAARDIWSRPALRAFYSATFWNDDAKGTVGGPAYANDTFGSNFGVQGEVWF